MRTLTLLSILALGAVAPLAAVEAGDTHAAVSCGANGCAGSSTAATKADAPHAPHATVLNSECPMCHKAVGDKPSTVKITVGEGAESKVYLLACKSKECADMFTKDPEPVLKKTFGKEAAGPKTLFK